MANAFEDLLFGAKVAFGNRIEILPPKEELPATEVVARDEV